MQLRSCHTLRFVLFFSAPSSPPPSLRLCLFWTTSRGEFSFFIAQEASDEGILTTEEYSAVVWALLLSSFAAPVFFRRVLTKEEGTNDNNTNGGGGIDLHTSNHSREREHEGDGGGVVTAAVR